jgi:hypothetical protein
MIDGLSVAIYSFNRGPWLANCVASVQRNLENVPITIIDDGSDDPETVGILDRLAQELPVARPLSNDPAGRHGGLYANMQRMLDACKTRFLLNLQDDTQIVRTFQAAEFDVLTALMDQQGAAFCSPLFAQGRSSLRKARIDPVSDSRCFHQWNSKLRDAQLLAYRDVAIMDVERIRQAGWRYEDSERNSARSARVTFGPMLLMADPFVAFVPEVPTFRARQRTIGARIAEAMVGRTLKPFQNMTPASVAQMRTRSEVSPARAALFLASECQSVSPPFEPNAVDVFRATRLLNKAEIALRRLFRRGSKASDPKSE